MRLRVTFRLPSRTLRDVDFHELYTRYAADVHRFALFLSSDRSLADDITSETFLRAWSAAAPIREATVKAYLFTIARNVYLAEVRRRARIEPLGEGLATDAPSPEARMTTRTRLEAALRALRALPEIDRSALLMRVQHRMPYDEIAATLRVSVSAAKVKVHRARQKLAGALPGVNLP
jgi:RNA polymerase sigma-70 factor (ECF subfamily)